MDKRVRTLGAEGLKAAEIAIYLNHEFKTALTSSAVIGRANRVAIELCGTNRKHFGSKSRKTKPVARKTFGFPKPDGARKAPKLDNFPAPEIEDHRAGQKLVEALRVITKSEPDSRSMLMVDIGAQECRFGTTTNANGQHLFCGHSVAPGRSYCPHHALRTSDLSTVTPSSLKEIVAAFNQGERENEIIHATGQRDRSRTAA